MSFLNRSSIIFFPLMISWNVFRSMIPPAALAANALKFGLKLLDLDVLGFVRLLYLVQQFKRFLVISCNKFGEEDLQDFEVCEVSVVLGVFSHDGVQEFSEVDVSVSVNIDVVECLLGCVGIAWQVEESPCFLVLWVLQGGVVVAVKCFEGVVEVVEELLFSWISVDDRVSLSLVNDLLEENGQKFRNFGLHLLSLLRTSSHGCFHRFVVTLI